jgi:mannan endo-1,4-beta-mannosidase
VKTPGLYTLTVGYASEYGDKQAKLVVNGGSGGGFTLPGSKQWSEATAGKALLVAGKNTVTIEKDWGYYEIDYLLVQPPAPPHNYGIPDTLVTPNPSAETLSLWRYLRSIYGKKTLSGQQDPYNHEEYLFDLTGERPALGGFDFIWYCPAGPKVDWDDTQGMIDWALKKKGIVTISWHWFSPSGSKNDPDNGSFYTKGTDFDLEAALDPQDPDYALLLRDIDAIAVQLKRLSTAKVPVLFRPLHEADGKWFWWGAKGPGPAKALWKLLFERVTQHHKLNNIIWVWNSASKEWLPDLNTVDVVSVDVYNDPRNYDPLGGRFDQLFALGGGKKMVALGENGPLPDPDLMKAADARWTWFNTWNNDFITTEKYSTNAHKKKVYQHELVLTLDELPDVYHFNP